MSNICIPSVYKLGISRSYMGRKTLKKRACRSREVIEVTGPNEIHQFVGILIPPRAAIAITGTKVLCRDVVLLFYVHGKHLRSCRDGQLT